MSVCHASCLARSAIPYLSPSPACACVHTKCRCCLIPARNLVVTHTHTLTYSLTHLSGGVWRAHPFVPYRTNKWHLSIKRIKRVHQKARLYLCAYENLFSLSFMCVCVCAPPSSVMMIHLQSSALLCCDKSAYCICRFIVVCDAI